MSAMEHFKNVVFTHGQIHVAGGALKRAEPVVSREAAYYDPEHPNASKTFVKLSTCEN